MQQKTATKTPATDIPNMALKHEYNEPCTTPQSDKESNTKRTPSINILILILCIKLLRFNKICYLYQLRAPLDFPPNPNNKYMFESFEHIHIPLKIASDSYVKLLLLQ